MQTITIGDAEITALTDVEGLALGLSQAFPGVQDDQWEPYRKLYPWAFADARTMLGRVGAYLVRSPGRTLLVDAGIGGWAAVRGSLLWELKACGATPEDVDTVFMTQLQPDHVGWLLTGDGEPVFENARHVVQEAEWELVGEYPLGRALAPLDGLGMLDLLYGEEELDDDLTAIPTPGHSPGHQSLLLASGRETVIFAGDVVVHPAQVTETTWNIVFSANREQSARTRALLLDWILADDMTIAAGHVPGSGFGRIGESQGRRRWLPVGDEHRAEEGTRGFGLLGGR